MVVPEGDMPLKVAPSLIAADQARLGEEARAVELAGADLLHLDVMDGCFVPNITIGPGVVKALRPLVSIPFDCHLMLLHPERYVEAFAEAGADRISVHVEVESTHSAIRLIRSLGKSPGLAVNPDTPVEQALEFAEAVDFFVVMTVHPGFYGQSMIRTALDKVPVLVQSICALGRTPVIQVDGGVTMSNAALVEAAGAAEVVAGAAVFKASDYRAAIAGLRGQRLELGA